MGYLVDQINELEDAYTRWVVCRQVGGEREKNALSQLDTSLANIFGDNERDAPNELLLFVEKHEQDQGRPFPDYGSGDLVVPPKPA